MQGRVHERCTDDSPLLDEAGEVSALEVLQPRPKADIEVWHLKLEFSIFAARDIQEALPLRPADHAPLEG